MRRPVIGSYGLQREQSSIVWRRRMTDHFAPSDQHFGGHRAAVVVGGHHRAVGAGVEHGKEIAGLRPRQPAILPSVSLLSQSGPTMSATMFRTRDACDRLDPVERAVQHRPHQLGHARIEDHEHLAVRPVLDVDDARQQRAGGRDDAAARLEDDRQAGLPDDRQHRGGVLLGGRHLRSVVRHPQAAAEIQMIDDDPVVPQFRRERDDRLPRRGAADRDR